nr:SEL1-like repeat protein [Ferrovibrio sp.]
MKLFPAALLLGAALISAPGWAAIGAGDAPFSQPGERLPGAQPGRADLQSRAEAGDAEAQYRLGLDYQLGLGGPRDLAAARAWFGRAAAQGHAKGLGALGYMLLSGSGGAADLAGAEAALRRAAGLGEASAMANLAEILLQRGGAAANTEARGLLAEAVRLGALNARYRLGRLTIADGRAAEGVALVRAAADRGHPMA